MVQTGSVLALKIWTGTNTKVFLKNMDNKSFKKHGITVSSSHPPRSSSNTREYYLFCMAGSL